MISKAKKPLFIIGSQATLAPTPVEELKSALERIGVPCFLGGMARGLLGIEFRFFFSYLIPPKIKINIILYDSFIKLAF